MKTPEKCPDCGGIEFLKSRYRKEGDYCRDCGLIFSTIHTRAKQKQKDRSRSSKVVKAQLSKPLKCLFCPTTTNLTKHHVIPKRMRKRTKLVVLCRPCHNIADMIANVLYPMEVEINETT